MTYEAGPGGPGVQRAVLGPAPWALLLLIPGAFLAVWGPLHSANQTSRVVIIILAVIMLAAGLAGVVHRVEITPDKVTVRELRGRRTLLLGQLASADLLVSDGRGGRSVSLRLRDQPGTQVSLMLTGYRAQTRQQALAALAPALMAPGVRRSGPIGEALSGSL
jgi:hypothetical protein